MNILATVTAEEFATAAIAWIGGVFTVLTFLLPKVAALKAQIDTLFHLHGENANAITTLAIHTPTPQAPSADAVAANTLATQENTAAINETKPS